MPHDSLLGFDILSNIRRRTKEAFTPSPAVAQAIMAQAQGQPPGGPPGDPTGAGGPPGGMPPGGPPGGAPPGMDPSQAGGAPPGPPPTDPSQAGAPPGGDPNAAAGGPPVLDPAIMQAIQQAVQQGLAQGGNGGGGAAGPGGKPNKDVMMQEMHHQIKALVAIVRPMAEALGLSVPAGHLFDMGPAAAGQTPGQPGQPNPAAGPSQPDPSQAGGPAPSSIAQQLPSLPSVASKAAAIAGLTKSATKKAASVVDLARISAGYPVAALPRDLHKSKAAALLVALAKRN